MAMSRVGESSQRSTAWDRAQLTDYSIIHSDETNCPDCGTELPSVQQPVCPSCHSRLERVDVGVVTQPSTTGKSCECGYDLTGISELVCPECGARVVFDITEYAVDPPVHAPVHLETPFTHIAARAITLIAGAIGGLLSLFSAVLIVHAPADWRLTWPYAAVGLLLFVSAALSSRAVARSDDAA